MRDNLPDPQQAFRQAFVLAPRRAPREELESSACLTPGRSAERSSLRRRRIQLSRKTAMTPKTERFINGSYGEVALALSINGEVRDPDYGETRALASNFLN
jgi:hypothetical protein